MSSYEGLNANVNWQYAYRSLKYLRKACLRILLTIFAAVLFFRR
jgi:hypothetical protein